MTELLRALGPRRLGRDGLAMATDIEHTVYMYIYGRVFTTLTCSYYLLLYFC